MLTKKVVTVSAGFGAETTSQDFKGMTERDTYPKRGRWVADDCRDLNIVVSFVPCRELALG